MTQRTPATLLLAAAAALLAPAVARANDVGHYMPGAYNIRDPFVPPPGVYGLDYQIFYTAHDLKDDGGHRVDSVTIERPLLPDVVVEVDTDVDVFALAPTVVFVLPWQPAGFRFGAILSQTIGMNGYGASLEARRRGVDVVNEAEFDLGDLLVQPVWAGLTLDHLELALSYGFYAPVGRYDVSEFQLQPSGVTVRAPDPSNVGLGFWEHQLQAAVGIYPFDNPGTMISTAVTWNLPMDKEGFDLTPGQRVSLNWGLSQFVPLDAEGKLLLEVGPAGYCQWKTSESHGADADNAYDRVYAAGGQIGLTYVPWNGSLIFKYQEEFGARGRFEGQLATFTIGFGKSF